MDAGPAEPGQPLVNLPARPGHALVADTASTLGGSATFRSGVLGLALLGAGVFVCLFGSFWLLYRGDEGSDNVTICIGDDDYNAQTIGAVALMIGVAAVWISLRLLRSGRRADRDADPI